MWQGLQQPGPDPDGRGHLLAVGRWGRPEDRQVFPDLAQQAGIDLHPDLTGTGNRRRRQDQRAGYRAAHEAAIESPAADLAPGLNHHLPLHRFLGRRTASQNAQGMGARPFRPQPEIGHARPLRRHRDRAGRFLQERAPGRGRTRHLGRGTGDETLPQPVQSKPLRPQQEAVGRFLGGPGSRLLQRLHGQAYFLGLIPVVEKGHREGDFVQPGQPRRQVHLQPEVPGDP